MNEVWNPNELYHHGIKGQKWGVRRFENYDGTLTQAGKDRYGYKNTERRRSNNKNSIKDFYRKHKTAINATAAIAATALVAYGAYKVANIDGGLADMGRKIISNINTDELISTVNDLGKKAGKVLSETGVKAGKAVGEAGVRAGKAVGKSIAKGTDAAISAAMATAGSIAILKIAEKYAPDDSDSETVKNIKKIAVESATAGINAATNANSSSNKNNNNNSKKGGNVGKEVSDAIGAPSNKGTDRSSARYQALFKDSNGNQRDADTRAIIKSMASAGYDIEQIEQYLELKHSYMFGGLYHSDVWNPDVLCHSDTIFGAGNQNGRSEPYHHGSKAQKWGVHSFYSFY